MKTQFLSRCYGWLILIMLPTSSFAQTAEGLKDPVPVVTTGLKTEVNEKLNKAFQQHFFDAQNIRWYESDKRFIVKFIMSEQQNMALFEKNGHLIWQITYGEEKHLPCEVRKLVKSNYFDYNIKMVFQVFQDNRTVWVINMEDEKNLVVVRVENGEIEKIEQLKKI